ncbi:MAG: restriction endonuclease subunit S, partial [Ruminococcus sp.]|nr:restriction endonuclease subunit S [Ruminococcus sp.]
MSKLNDLIYELCSDGVEFKKLSEIFDIRNGYTPSKKIAEYWENGTVPWFRMEDIRENGRILSSALQNVTIQALKNKPFPADSIIVSTSATIGEHALITTDFICNQRFTCLTLKKNYR